MRRRIWIVAAVFLCLVALICILPLPSDCSEVYDAVVLDENGNVLETSQLSIQGVRYAYLVRKDRLSVTVSGFQDGRSLTLDTSNLEYNTFSGYLRLNAVILSTDIMICPDKKTNEPSNNIADKSYSMIVSISPDLECWCIQYQWESGKNRTYLFSINDRADHQQLMSYFAPLIP